MTAAKNEAATATTTDPTASTHKVGDTMTVTVRGVGKSPAKNLTLTFNEDGNWYDAEGQRREENGALKETKAESFTRIAKRRMGATLSDIRNLQGLASKLNYEYTDDQWAKMFAALESELADLKKVVSAGGKQAADTGFTF